MKTDDLRTDTVFLIHLNPTPLRNQSLMHRSSVQLMNQDIFKQIHVFLFIVKVVLNEYVT